jgi:Trypsin
VAGTSDLSKTGYRHLIASFVIHPKYKELRTSDIAIMKVTSPFIYNFMVGPIKYSDRHVGGNQRTMLTGWGYTFPIRIGAPPKMLQRAEFMTLSNKQCIIRGLRPTSTEICAYKRLLVGACGGDSGGPLVNNGELIGIVSYGTAICASGLPDVYTRVSVFYDWIRENTDYTSPAKDPDASGEEVVDEEEEAKQEDSEKDDDGYNEEPEVIERNHAIFNNPIGDKISSSYLLPGSKTPVYSKSYPLFYSKESMPFLYGDVDLPITFYELDEFR